MHPGPARVQPGSPEYKEYFISLESKDQVVLFGFIRLRIPPKHHKPLFGCLINMGLIRELHVYGNLVPVGEKSIGDIQHNGVGKILVKKAEWVAWLNGCHGAAIISGEGVKAYYQKLGYYESQTYMIKKYLITRTVAYYRKFIILATIFGCWTLIGWIICL